MAWRFPKGREPFGLDSTASKTLSCATFIRNRMLTNDQIRLGMLNIRGELHSDFGPPLCDNRTELRRLMCLSLDRAPFLIKSTFPAISGMSRINTAIAPLDARGRGVRVDGIGACSNTSGRAERAGL
jgi:hypothetical protein